MDEIDCHESHMTTSNTKCSFTYVVQIFHCAKHLEEIKKDTSNS